MPDASPAPDVVTVGDVMLDVAVSAPELARGGDVHGRVRVRPGGSAANAAAWAADAGARARVIGRVGDDLAGRLLAAELARHGVDPMLAVDRRAETGTMLVVSEAGERSMVADRGANARLSPGDLPFGIDAPAVLVSGYLLLFEPTMGTAIAALDRALGPHRAVDAASWPLVEAFGVDRFFTMTQRASILFANEREAEILAGVAGGEEAADALAGRFATVCVKLGARGAIVAHEGRRLAHDADPIEEVDPTGAGDAFDGAFLAALALGGSVEEGLEAGCRAGARAAAGPEPWPAPRTPGSRTTSPQREPEPVVGADLPDPFPAEDA